ncbi:hypothetical protein [Pontiella sulfatireligans]|uniref:Uncharacterized protein n=1 Tax=Pontiella sulfatireligans TaxID=2750658 RepID=A0A6C2URI8_9BACT|nr:hypothetical protein [Pontiella sulfatireligans]VGO21546.1 hypothetical protein SCARR_03620 [Pontiella sulfatireligans]
MDDSRDQLDFNFAADDLLEFPRDLGEEGWFQFLSEQKLAIQRVEEKFGIVLNRRVRLRLRGWDEVFEGKLVLDSLLFPPPQAESLQLRLGRMTFENTDIDYCESL